MSTRLLTVTACAACAAASVATDSPPLGPVWMPPPHVSVDLCSEPRTLAEAHDVLAQMLDPALLKEIKARPEGFTRQLNGSVGMALRNMWGLWNGSPLRNQLVRLGVRQPDDMSELVLVTFRRHLNDLPLDVVTEIAELRSRSSALVRPGLRCSCVPVGRCRSTFIVSPLPGVQRGFELTDCCCLRTPRVVEGVAHRLPDAPAGVIVLPPAMSFKASACGPRFGREN